MKPSDRTPISALVLAEILSEAGLPEGAFSVLPCENQDAHVFSTDPNISSYYVAVIPYYNTHGAPIKQVLIKTEALSFTGSAAVGWKLKQAAGKAKVLLELGGNAAVIVDETADVERAAQRLLWGAFYSQGQSCISVQRIYLHESVYDAIAQKLKVRENNPQA
jgi:acyl-CoA reductase-like NAD-dependent aldehyde dehydrogenase